MSGVTRSHHVSGIKELVGELVDREVLVRLGGQGAERGVTGHEEMKAWKWYHVHSKFPQVGVQLARESEASGQPGPE